MILLTHAVIGAAAGSGLHNPESAFVIGFFTHYLADAIPHWHYHVPSIRKATLDHSQRKTLMLDASFHEDFLKIAIDAVIGLVLALALFDGDPRLLVTGAIGAIMPDILVGLSKYFPLTLLHWHYRFHYWMHSTLRLDDRPVLGITAQLIIIIGLPLFVGSLGFWFGLS